MNKLNETENKIESMDPIITKATIDFYYNKNNFDSTMIPIKSDLLKFAKLNYNYNEMIYNPNDESEVEELFSWKKDYVKIWCIGVGNQEISKNSIIYFATKYHKDEIILMDLVSETSSIDFYKLDDMQQISYLIENKLISDISDELIPNSINGYSIISEWTKEWIKNEYKSIDKLIQSPHELFKFNESIIRAKRYQFEDMLLTLDNQQFSLEFDECLYAYNNQKWFICAAGLGGILEHLLYLILEKNNMLDPNFPDDATAKIYLEYLSRKPIKLQKRNKTYIKSLFIVRNSISHYNQGLSSMSQCKHLMDGIKNVFNNLYMKDFSL